MQKGHAGALCHPIVFCTDGFRAHRRAIRAACRDPVRTGRLGRPRLRPWDSLLIAQVVKRYARRRVVAVCRRVVQGTLAQVEALLRQTQTTALIHTAYIERLNATFRARLCQTRKQHRYLNRHYESVGPTPAGWAGTRCTLQTAGARRFAWPCRIKQPISLVEDGL